jgi:hypothetical protein
MEYLNYFVKRRISKHVEPTKTCAVRKITNQSNGPLCTFWNLKPRWTMSHGHGCVLPWNRNVLLIVIAHICYVMYSYNAYKISARTFPDPYPKGVTLLKYLMDGRYTRVLVVDIHSQYLGGIKFEGKKTREKNFALRGERHFQRNDFTYLTLWVGTFIFCVFDNTDYGARIGVANSWPLVRVTRFTPKSDCRGDGYKLAAALCRVLVIIPTV